MRREGLLDPNSVIRTASHWRMRAEEMRTIADEAHDPTVKAMMLRIAADYERLAKHADETAAQLESLGSNAGMSRGDGRTIDLRIRINRRGGGNARCSGSRARG